MDVNKIRNLAVNKNINLKDLAEKIGMSEGGFHQSLKNNTLKVSVIEKIAEILQIPVFVLFEDNEIIKSEENVLQPETINKINTRFKKIMHHAELNQIQFAGRIGIAADRLNKIINNSIDFGVEVLQGIAKAFPEIDMRWLLLGVGEMEIKQSIAAESSVHYGKPCKQCEEANNTIKNLNKLLSKVEVELEDCRKLLPEEKRKVS
jgi:transcriptional regulator with XRE-family HTH domain